MRTPLAPQPPLQCSPAAAKTIAWAPFGLTACLRLAEQEFESTEWRPRDKQKSFMEQVFRTARSSIDSIPEQHRRCIAANTAAKINEFLSSHGSGKIRLAKFQDANSLGLAAITKVVAEWSARGTRTSISLPDERAYTAASLKSGVLFYSTGPSKPTLVKIRCKDNIAAFMTPVVPSIAGAVTDCVSLVRTCQTLTRDAHSPVGDYHGVIFPMVDFEQEADLGWLTDLELVVPKRKRPMFVRQAKQLMAFRMNHIGAKFQDEVAIEMAMRGGSNAPPFKIDCPFLFWITKEGLQNLPMFAAVFGEETWKDPGDNIGF